MIAWKLKPWQTLIIFGILVMILYALGTYFFDFFAGTATVGFGIMGKVMGMGMFFIYMIGYFLAILVILPILLIRRFGTGLIIFIPYAVTGFFVELYYEWFSSHTLISPWGAVGWCIAGLMIGLSADLSFRFLPARLSEKWRAIITGIVLGSASFIFNLIPLIFFYKIPMPVNPVHPGTYLGVAYFGAPWLILHSAFGGFTAYAIASLIKSKEKKQNEI